MADVQDKHNVFRRSADVVIRRLSRHHWAPPDPPASAAHPHLVDPNPTVSASITNESTMTTDGTSSPEVAEQPVQAEQAPQHPPAHRDRAPDNQPPMHFWSRVISHASSGAPSDCIPPEQVPESTGTATNNDSMIFDEPVPNTAAGTNSTHRTPAQPKASKNQSSSPDCWLSNTVVDFNPFDVLQLGTITLQKGQIQRASESVQPADLIPLQSRDSTMARTGSMTSSRSRTSGSLSTCAASNRSNTNQAFVASPPRTPRLMTALDFGDVVQDHVLLAASKLRHPSRSRSTEDRPPWAAPAGQALLRTQSEAPILADAQQGGNAQNEKQRSKPRSYSVVGLSPSQAMAHHKAIKSIHGYRGHEDLMPVVEDATGTNQPKQRSASVDMGSA